MLPYVTIRKFAAESGYTEEAIRAKIKSGIWLQDQVWVKAPDGRILISIEGFYEWVDSAGVPKSKPQQASKPKETVGRSRLKPLV
jgi:hypothetical protein